MQNQRQYDFNDQEISHNVRLLPKDKQRNCKKKEGKGYNSRLNFNIKVHMQSPSWHHIQRSKAASMVSSDNKRRERSSYQKYIVVDSQNQEEYGNRIKWDVDRSPRPNSIQLQTHKNRGKSSCNIEYHQSHCLRSIDEDISAAEEEVKRLQQECIILQKIMNKVIKESAELKVEEHKRKRSRSLHRDEEESLRKMCTVHKQLNSGAVPQHFQQIIKSKLSGISSSSQTWSNTLLLSQSKEEIYIEDHQPNKKKKPNKAIDQQNIAPPKDHCRPTQSLHISYNKSKKQVR